ncbi:hypothetical protein [Agrobacterium rosae]|uniref:hypothetical protein n=1 Tax=Agrobacterium rosae TaxID=1972867 RepID=UPI002A23CC62|nr:hypothetical protein [Agrobacterium rosae]
MRNAIATSFGIASILVVSFSFLIGCFLFLAPSGGGFFPDLGLVVGLMGIATGNLISWICNGICWLAGKRVRWLAAVLVSRDC